jgi:hypothetical protein
MKPLDPNRAVAAAATIALAVKWTPAIAAYDALTHSRYPQPP